MRVFRLRPVRGLVPMAVTGGGRWAGYRCVGRMLMLVRRFMGMGMVLVTMWVISVRFRVALRRRGVPAMMGGQVNVELDPRDAVFQSLAGVQMVTRESQPGQLAFEGGEADAQVDKRADEHVAAQAAGEIEIEHAHDLREEAGALAARRGAGELAEAVAPAARALIWLAA